MSEQIKYNEEDFNVIGDVFENLRFHGAIFFTSDLAAPWGLSLEQTEFPLFHISVSGGFCLRTDSKDLIHVREREIIVLTDGDAHWIADQPGRKLTPGKIARNACQLGQPLFQQGKTTNRIICGLINYDQALPHPIFDSIPTVMHFSKFEPNDPIWLSVNLIDTEMRRTDGHGSPIVDRLTEALFLQLLNRYFSENNETLGYFAALRDRQTHKALKLIHQAPGFEWSLTSLSERVGMSRATLVRHFQDTVGVAPMTYVKNWRMLKAYSLVKNSNITLERIAQSVGFTSARTLSKAFQRHYDYTPSELRTSIKQKTSPRGY